MKKITFKIMGAAILAVVFIVGHAQIAEAKVVVTVNNQRDHAISLAFCWNGFDSPDDMVKGWYVVKAGESKSFTFKDVISSLTMDGFGYYAKGRTSEGKNIVWKGDLRQITIHPTKAFACHPDDSIEGGITVGFRKVTLIPTGDQNTDARATLTFKP